MKPLPLYAMEQYGNSMLKTAVDTFVENQTYGTSLWFRMLMEY